MSELLYPNGHIWGATMPPMAENITVTKETVLCRFTIDAIVDGAWIDGKPLQVYTEDAKDWRKVKWIAFEEMPAQLRYAPFARPATLAIQGHNPKWRKKRGPAAGQLFAEAGLLLACRSCHPSWRDLASQELSLDTRVHGSDDGSAPRDWQGPMPWEAERYGVRQEMPAFDASDWDLPSRSEAKFACPQCSRSSSGKIPERIWFAMMTQHAFFRFTPAANMPKPAPLLPDGQPPCPDLKKRCRPKGKAAHRKRFGARPKEFVPGPGIRLMDDEGADVELREFGSDRFTSSDGIS